MRRKPMIIGEYEVFILTDNMDDANEFASCWDVKKAGIPVRRLETLQKIKEIVFAEKGIKPKLFMGLR